jgi:hypothetical protein
VRILGDVVQAIRYGLIRRVVSPSVDHRPRSRQSIQRQRGSRRLDGHGATEGPDLSAEKRQEMTCPAICTMYHSGGAYFSARCGKQVGMLGVGGRIVHYCQHRSLCFNCQLFGILS